MVHQQRLGRGAEVAEKIVLHEYSISTSKSRYETLREGGGYAYFDSNIIIELLPSELDLSVALHVVKERVCFSRLPSGASVFLSSALVVGVDARVPAGRTGSSSSHGYELVARVPARRTFFQRPPRQT